MPAIPEQPPCDNEHVAPGCEPFAEAAVPDYTAMNQSDLLTSLGDDASLWAAAFCQYAKALGHEIDQGWMIGWFACAIEHSSDVRRWRSEPKTRPIIPAESFP